MDAITPGRVERARRYCQALLNEFRADANSKSKGEWTPLHKAAQKGHVGVVKLLRTSSGRTRMQRGWTPLHLAALNGHVNVVKLLVNEFRADTNAK